MERNKNLIKRLVLFFIGVWIIQTGVAIFINVNIGSDPFTVLTQGLAKTLSITTGTANIMITSTCFIAILITSRKSIKIGTILSLVSAGPFIDLMLSVTNIVPFNNFNMIIKIILLCISCIIIAIGFSTLKATDLGVAPNDLVPLIIQEKVNCNYQWIRISMDSLFVIAGFLLGGKVGLGTIVAVLLTGPAIQFFMPKLDKIIKSSISNENSNELSLKINKIDELNLNSSKANEVI